MTINTIAKTVFNSFEDTDFVLAIVSRNGSYISNNVDVFEKVFSEAELLDGLRSKIDDGCEPVIAHIDGFLIAASSVNHSGYSVMLVPQCDADKSIDYTGFIEVILSQISTLAGKILRESENSFEYEPELVSAAVLN